MNQPRSLSIRRSTAWNFAGNSLYSLAQWLLLVLLARLAAPELVGSFALILSISAPVFMTLGMNLRIVQATDAVRRWRLEDYLLLRHVVNLFAIALAVIVGIIAHLDSSILLALSILTLAKSVEGISQTYYGFFQQFERHDYVAQSMMARSVAGPIFFSLGYGTTNSLAGACLGLIVGWGLPQGLLDRPRARRLHSAEVRLLPAQWASVWRLARKATPMGLDQGASSLSVNVPRYVIEALLGATSLGLYSTLSYLAQAASMVTSALGIVAVPRLAIYNRDGRRRAFVRLLLLQVAFSLLVVAIAILTAAVLGEWFVGSVLGKQYVNQDLLLVLLVSGGIVTLQRCLGRGLSGTQRFKSFLAIDLVTVVGVTIAALALVPVGGLIGAAWSTAIGFGLGSILALFLVVRVVRKIGT